MEQKKLLWILFSVTLFLLVLVGAGFIWFFPGESEIPVAMGERSSADSSNSFDPVEWVRQSDRQYPGLEEPVDEQGDGSEGFVIVYGESPASDSPVARQKEPAVSTGQATVSARETAPAEKPAARQAPPAASAEPVAAKPQPVSRTVSEIEYWIQAGSFQSRDGAESANRILTEKGLSGRLTTKNIDGKEFYRVRLGPYGKQEEAQKFLDWVKAVDQFQGSYISQVRVNRTVSE
jgi:DedD protein